MPAPSTFRRVTVEASFSSGTARRNVEINSLDDSRADWVAADVFAYLRRLRDQNKRYGLIVLDPPKFAPTEKHVPNAARAYKDINLWAMKLLAPGGHLLTFSCSGAITPDLFQKIVAGAAADAKVDLQVRRHLGAALDHPSSIHFPESTVQWLGAFRKVTGLRELLISSSARVYWQSPSRSMP